MDVFGERGYAPPPLRLSGASPVCPPRPALVSVAALAFLVGVAVLVEPCWRLYSECPPLLEAVPTDTDYRCCVPLLRRPPGRLRRAGGSCVGTLLTLRGVRSGHTRRKMSQRVISAITRFRTHITTLSGTGWCTYIYCRSSQPDTSGPTRVVY